MFIVPLLGTTLPLIWGESWHSSLSRQSADWWTSHIFRKLAFFLRRTGYFYSIFSFVVREVMIMLKKVRTWGYQRWKPLDLNPLNFVYQPSAHHCPTTLPIDTYIHRYIGRKYIKNYKVQNFETYFNKRWELQSRLSKL